MNTLGTVTKSTFLKEINGGATIHEEFEVEGLTYTVTFSAALVASNTIDGYVGGNAIAQVTYATSSDATMAAIAVQIALMPGVKSATVVNAGTSDRVIIVTPTDQVAGIGITGMVVAAGASQATVAVAAVNKKIYPGMPVELNATSGKIQPATAATASTTHIGIALHTAVEGQLCTVAMHAKCIIYARSADALAYGPVAYSSYDAVNLYNKVTDTSVTATNIIGWTLDTTTGADETVRVALK